LKIGILISPVFQQSFVNFIQAKGSMPIASAMKFLKLKRFLSDYGQDSETIKQRIIEKFAVRDSDGNVKVVDGNYEVTQSPEFIQEWTEFLNTEVEIPSNLRISEEEFTKMNIEVTVNELQLLIENLS